MTGQAVTGMSAGLSRLSDDALTRLRSRVEQVMRTGAYEQRSVTGEQLAAIDIERERRLSAVQTELQT